MQQIDNTSLKELLTRCPQCGGRLSVTADPYNSCFDAECCDDRCGHRFRHPVRASALSLPGVVQLAGAVLCGVAGYGFTRGLGLVLTVFSVVLGVLLGWLALAFILRLSALLLLRAQIPLIWKAEMIAYLAPPPFLKRTREQDGA